MRLQHPDVAKIWHELKKDPEGASEQAMTIWKGLKQNFFELFVSSYPKDESSLFDMQARFVEWTNSKGSPITGFRHQVTKKQHGICRVITPDG